MLLLYLGKLSRPKYHEFSLELLIFPVLQYKNIKCKTVTTWFTYLLLFNFRCRKEQWQHSFAFYVLVLYELQNLRPRAVIWCLHRSKCVVDLPALRRSPCWHATGHRENILASAKHSLRRHKKTLKHTVAVTAFQIGYSSADFAALCCITNIVNSAVVLIDRQFIATVYRE